MTNNRQNNAGRVINGVDNAVAEQIIKIILSYKKAEKIVLFGSRTTKIFKRTSDIDIAVFAKGWSDRDFNIIKHTLNEDVKIPLKFDVINFYAITKEKLIKNILAKGSVIYEHRKD
ncbi:MAG: nucleotidyltransferase domain-containing protein [bacterium]